MKLTKNEKKLLEAIIEIWQQEGCPNINAWIWGRDARNPDDNHVRDGDDELGNKLIREAAKGLEQKLKIKIKIYK